MGGGALLDVGVYAIDAARWLIGAEPSSIAGRTSIDVQRGIELAAAAALVFPGDILASVACSFTANGGGTYEIYGPFGRIAVQEAFVQRPGFPPRVTWPDGEEVFPPGMDQHRLMFEAFSGALLRDDPPPLADDAGVGNIATVEALRQQ